MGCGGGVDRIREVARGKKGKERCGGGQRGEEEGATGGSAESGPIERRRKSRIRKEREVRVQKLHDPSNRRKDREKSPNHSPEERKRR